MMCACLAVGPVLERFSLLSLEPALDFSLLLEPAPFAGQKVTWRSVSPNARRRGSGPLGADFPSPCPLPESRVAQK